MMFSKISVAAISMALFSLASAAPATNAAIEARGNCYGDAVLKGAQCVLNCAGKAGAEDCATGCSITTLGELAACTAQKQQ